MRFQVVPYFSGHFWWRYIRFDASSSWCVHFHHSQSYKGLVACLKWSLLSLNVHQHTRSSRICPKSSISWGEHIDLFFHNWIVGSPTLFGWLIDMVCGSSCQKFNLPLLRVTFIPTYFISITMPPKESDRTYLRQEEKAALQLMLQEWVNQPDKKSRDAFVSRTALPKIQELNADEFRPEVMDKNKVVRVQWEKRVSVSWLSSVCCLHIPHLYYRLFIHGSRTTSHSRTDRFSNWRERSLSAELLAS